MALPLANAAQTRVAQWITDEAGWRAVFALLGGLSALLIVAPGYLIQRNGPEDLGLLPDGAQSAGGGPPSGERAPRSESVSEHDFTLKQALQTEVFWFIVVAGFLSILGGGAVSFHQVAYFQDIGLSPAVAAATIS